MKDFPLRFDLSFLVTLFNDARIVTLPCLRTFELRCCPESSIQAFCISGSSRGCCEWQRSMCLYKKKKNSEQCLRKTRDFDVTKLRSCEFETSIRLVLLILFKNQQYLRNVRIYYSTKMKSQHHDADKSVRRY